MPHSSRREARLAAVSPQSVETGDPRRRRRRIIGFSVVGVVVLLLIAGLWILQRAMVVKGELESAAQVVSEVQAGADLAESITSLSDHAAIAAETAGDPVWRVAELIPAAGDNLRAVRLAAQSLDALVNRIGLPILDDDGSGESVMQKALRVSVAEGSHVAQLSRELDEVSDSPFLIGAVQSGVDQITEVTSAAGPALELLPTVLGAEGPKTYLMVFQNNAEALALGGSPASQTLVHVDAGTIAMGAQADSGRYRNGTAVDVDVDESALDLYSTYLTAHMNTSMLRPDFPTGAQLLKAWWQRDINADHIDGVISVDPIALSRILVATGPIPLPSGDELNSDNAVRLLLSEVYSRWDSYKYPELVDGFFAAAASAVFDKVAAGEFDLKDMLWAIGESAARGDILLWSEDEKIADAIRGQRVSGALPADNEETTTVGVFYNNGSASKIDFYTRSEISATSACTDGVRSTTVTSSLLMDIDQDAADELPRYVMSNYTGSSAFLTRVFIYGPVGGEIASVSVDGREVSIVRDDAEDLGRPVASFEVSLAPTEQATVSAVFTSPEVGGPLTLQSTPMIHPGSPTVEDACTS
ncbi:DUF4012 domain-containing protein [Microbacterium caowuchunii]|uniref:DUF4012 domain-containing protein n=1 Tax=Microbacterium caowuchunii TaxID=2614638 RepID=UPI001248C1EB|nr:DUF4012 domain-containing protein [Microbacterium caowuchunii]QEV99034.1 DUF4012 domain-containing protein [Microbacterium caowuchunii]